MSDIRRLVTRKVGRVRVAGRAAAPGALGAGLALVLAMVLAVPASALVYVWNNPGSGDWTTATNWTPTRSSLNNADTLIVNGAITPTPHILKVPSQTIRGLGFINNVNALVETDGSRTLAIKDGAGPYFLIEAGCTVRVAGVAGRPLKFNLDRGAKGNIYGTLIFENNKHKIVSKAVDPIIFHAGSFMIAGTGFLEQVFDDAGDEKVAIFQAGATYIHETGLTPFGFAAPKTKIIFEEGSTAIFRNTDGFDAKGRTFANLKIENGIVISQTGNLTFQFDTLTVSGGSSLTYLGDVNNGIVIRGDVRVLDTSTADLQVKASRTMSFAGNRVQVVGGDATATAVIGGPTFVALGTTLALEHALTQAANGMTVNGTLEFRPGGVLTTPSNVIYGAGSTLRYNDSTSVHTVSSGSREWPSSSGPPNVDVRAAGVTMSVARTVPGQLTVAGPITNANQLTLPGITRLEAGGSMTGIPTYSGTATLVFAASRIVGGEWGPGTTVGVGVPFSVTVDAGAGTVTLPGSARRAPGNLTILSGTLTLSPAGPLSVGGNWSHTGGTFAPNGGTVKLDGSGTQTVAGPGRETFDYLTLAKAAGTVQLLSDVEIAGPAGGPALVFDGTGEVLDLNGRNLRLLSSVGGTDATYALKGSATSGLLVQGSGPAGIVRFQTGAQTLDSLTVNRSAGGGLTLASDLSVGAALLLTNGVVSTGPDTLTVGAGGAVTRTNGYVSGNLRRSVPAGAPSMTFDVGTAGTYAPLSVSFASVTTPGAFTASTTDGLHPNAATSGLDPANTVTRYHTLTNEGTGFTNYDLLLNYNPVDVPVTAILDSFEVRRFSGGTWTAPTLGTVTGSSAQALGVTGVGQFIVGERLHHRIYASSGPNGSISPADTVIVRDHANITYTMTPATGYEVEDVKVDNVSVGAVNSYTFVSVTQDHTISVTFKVRTFVVNTPVNGLGKVTRDINLPAYTYGTHLVLTAVPETGWKFENWSGNINTTFNPVGFNVDSAMTITANFSRVPMDYTRSTFSAPYTAISTAGGASKLMVTADDSTRTIPMPFRFVFSGNAYDSTNYLAVNANGFAYLSRTPVTQSLSFFSNNSNLFAVIPPNGTIAPWYDNLSVGPVGTNPNGSVLYQTVTVPGSGRALVVQWTDVSAYATNSGGQPRRINFQMVLYEGLNSLEFRYGPITGTGASTLESASIGIEDSLGGNGRYIDAVTGSRYTNNGMMTTNKWPTRNFRFVPGKPAPLAGTYDVGLGRTYTSFSAAVADLNHRGMSGPVTFRLRDAVYDTTAGSGSNVFPILLGPVDGNSAANPISIESTVGPSTVRFLGTSGGNAGNQVLPTVIGTSNEPIFGIVGADYVTVKDVSFEGGGEVDRGVLLVQSSTSDGAQHNTLQDVSVRLNRANLSTIGIQQFAASTPASPDGANSNNRYYNVSVRNAYAGVSLAGNVSVMDDGCEVGSVGGGLTLIGSTIKNEIGGGASQTFGIRALNQSGLRVFGTDVRGVGANGTGAVDGISIENSGSSLLGSGMIEVYGNQVSDLTNDHVNAGRVVGIRVNLSRGAGSESRVYNNFVHSLQSLSLVTTSRRVAGIVVQEGGGGAGAEHNVDFNSVRIAPAAVDASNACFEIGTAAGPVVKVRNNVFANFTAGQSGSAKHYAWSSPSISLGPAGSVSDRNVLYIRNLVNGFTGLAGGLDQASLATWQSTTGQDGASFGTNPQFVNAANLHIVPGNPTPVESAGSNFGGDITWVASDFDGDVRNPATPDIGADEGVFATPVDDDMEATAFVNPQAGGSVLAGASFSPQITFANAGLLPQTGVNVRLRILGPQPATTEIYNQTAVIASADVGAAVNVTFPSTSIAVGGFYVMEATALLAGDTNPANDQITALLDVAGPLAGTYTVGSVQPAPFNTLTSAITRLNTVGVSGPTTFLLEDSLYADTEIFPLNIDPIPGASAVNTFTLKVAPGAHPLVSASTQRALIVLRGADYVTVDGSNTPGGKTRDLSFINNDQSQAGAVIWGQTTNGDPATNNTIKNVNATGAGHDYTEFGIGFGGSTISIVSLGSGNDGNRIDNCMVQRAQYGIYSAGNSSGSKNSGTVIANNVISPVEFDRIGRGGIYVRFENGIQITGNRITNLYTAATTTVFGISLGMQNLSSEAISGDEVTNATVSGNTIDYVKSDNPTGLSVAGLLIAPAASGTTTVANNMISRIHGPATDPDFTVGILVGGGAATTRVYFNSVALDGDRGTGTASSFALVIAGSNPVVDVRNNVLVNRHTGGLAGDPYVIGLDYGTYTNLTSNRNVLLGDGVAPFAVVGGLANQPVGDLMTFADWKTTTGKDANSIYGAPLFVNTANLHIGQSGSPTAGAGVSIAGITTDIDGNVRANPPDIGADEYVSHMLNVTIAGAGSVSRNPDATQYIDGTPVTVTATADPGYHFVGWSGDTTTAANPVTFTLYATKNVTATFAINTYTVTTTASAGGSVARLPDQPQYDHGTALTLRAVPDLGYHFTGWSGDTTATVDSLAITVTSNRSYTATFAINTYTLALGTAGHGATLPAPDQPQYDHGTAVQITAIPEAGHTFLGWSGDTTTIANPISVVMTGNRSYVAAFTRAVNVTLAGNGTVTRSPDLVGYVPGDSVRLEAIPDVGHHFTGWSGDTTTTDNPIQPAVGLTDLDVTAGFAINTYPLLSSVLGSGSVARDPDQPLYDHGSAVELTAVPDPGHHFVAWSGDTTGSDNPITVTVLDTVSVTAEFAINTYTVNAPVVGNGAVERVPEQATYDHGTPLVLRAVPDFGFHFVGWSGDTATTVDSLEVVVTSDRTYTATFEINTYVLDITLDGSGEVATVPDLVEYDHGTEVELTALPFPGHTFLGWEGDTTGTDNPFTVIMTGDRSYTAHFTYALAVSASGGGAVTRTPDLSGYVPGTEVTVRALPDPGYHFVAWSGDTTETVDSLVVTMTGDRSYAATFAINTYTLDLSAFGSGAVAAIPDQPLYDHGTAITITATSNPGHAFLGWSQDTTETDSTLNIVITGDRAYAGQFTYAVTTVADTGGIVTRSPDGVAYMPGDTIRVEAIADEGYSFTGWSGDTTGTDNPVTFTIDHDISVAADFEIHVYALTVSDDGNGWIARVPDLPLYTHGSLVQLAPQPNPGYHFASWGGDTSGSATPVDILMDGPKSVSASFALNDYALDTPVLGGGTVTRDPDQPTYIHGSVVSLTAVPTYPYTFVGWGGDASGSTNPINVTMDGAKTVQAVFQTDSFTVQTPVTGDGTVDQDPIRTYFGTGESVILTATPATGYQFSGWSGDVTSIFNPLAVVVDSNMVVVANFVAAPPPVINLTIEGNGTVTKDPDLPSYAPGTPVTLTAVPDSGNVFEYWAGDVISTAPSIQPVMDRDKNITAHFHPVRYTLDAVTLGGGTVARDPDQADYNHFDDVTLTATPDPGAVFLHWAGDTSGTQNPITVPVWDDRTIEAVFGQPITRSIVGQGRIEITPDVPFYPQGDSVQVRAIPAPGYAFAGWSPNVAGGSALGIVAMNGPQTVTATFTAGTYALDIAVEGPGTVTRDPDQERYGHGQAVTIQGLPEYGYGFVEWVDRGGDAETRMGTPHSGAACEECNHATENPLTLTMRGDRSLIARFEILHYPLALSKVGNGTVSVVPDQPLYDHGTPIQITATPLPGHTFVGWAGDTSGTENPLDLIMTGSRTVVAQFTLSVDVATVGFGTVTKTPDLAVYLPGDTLQLLAVPDPGYHFAGWSGDSTSLDPSLTLILGDNVNLTATFEINTYTLDVTSGAGGSATRDPDQTAYDHGSVVTLTAVPDTGYHFMGWTGDTTEVANPITVVLTGNRAYTASFAINTYTVDVTPTAGGSVVRDPEQPTYDHGTEITLTAVPDTGYTFTGWGGDTTTTDNPLTITVTANRSYTATFVLNQYTLDVSAGTGGSVTRDPDQPTYAHGTVVTLTGVPDTGYHFTGWSGDTTEVANPITLVMTGNRSYGAAFGFNSYALTVDMEGSGAVSVVPDLPSYPHGTEVTITATPDPGQNFIGWTGDTSGTATPLVITMTGDRSYLASFTVTLDITVIGNGTVTKTPDQAFYLPYDLVVLQAVADAGNGFVGWSGDTVEAVSEIELLMDKSYAITATFQPSAALILRTQGEGEVVRATDPSGTATVEAVARPGWRFAGWGEDLDGTDNPRAIPEGAHTVLARFERTVSGVALATPLPAWVVGQEAELRWTADGADASARAELLLSRAGRDGPYAPIATDLPATGSHRWTVEGPEEAEAFVLIRVRDGAGAEAADTVAVEIGPDPFAVKAFELGPIAPNPLTIGTQITYALPREARVTVSVIDIQGREVARLVDGRESPGRHTVFWDGRASGGLAPSGQYFVRYQHPGGELVRRLTVTR